MSIEQVLAANLDALMSVHPEFKSQMKLSKASGVGQTTVGRMRRAEGAATIDNVQKVAKVFNLQAPDLLKPGFAKRLLENSTHAMLATSIASQIETLGFTEKQLQIVQNTLDALKSG